MKIRSYLNEYEVIYVRGFNFFEAYKNDKTALAVIDRRVYELYQKYVDEYFSDNKILIDADEHIKNAYTSLDICEFATNIDAKRNLQIIAIGGGIIQDIAGFAANILYRGTKLVLVPTTLLAQGDSCIGSKNSLNHAGENGKSYKNLLGTIYPPSKVIISPDFLPTLSDLEFHSGLGEVVRFVIMSGEIDYVETSLPKILERDYEAVNKVVEKAHVYKKAMVELDEFDLNERRIFNYGHTFGHAIEAISKYGVPHGLAIVLGMIMANHISVKRGILNEAIATRIESICVSLYNTDPPDICDIERYINALKKDKKRQGSGIAAVLASDEGQLTCYSVVQDVTEEEVADAVQYVSSVTYPSPPNA